MKTTVQFLRQPAEEIEAWINAQPGRDPERRALAKVAIAALIQRLQLCAGPPPEAIFEPGFQPPVWWWRYYPDLWIQFCVEDLPKGLARLFRERSRLITIVRAQKYSPDPGA